jgi:hypothetical protein
MSEIAVMDNVSVTQLRILSVVALLATAVIATLLTLGLAAAGAALARLARRVLASASRGDARRTGPSPGSPASPGRLRHN